MGVINVSLQVDEQSPQNAEELDKAIKNAWKLVTPELCQAYILRIHAKVRAVIAVNGKATKF